MSGGHNYNRQWKRKCWHWEEKRGVILLIFLICGSPESLRGYSISPDKSPNDIPHTETVTQKYTVDLAIFTWYSYWFVLNSTKAFPCLPLTYEFSFSKRKINECILIIYYQLHSFSQKKAKKQDRFSDWRRLQWHESINSTH